MNKKVKMTFALLQSEGQYVNDCISDDGYCAGSYIQALINDKKCHVEHRHTLTKKDHPNVYIVRVTHMPTGSGIVLSGTAGQVHNGLKRASTHNFG